MLDFAGRSYGGGAFRAPNQSRHRLHVRVRDNTEEDRRAIRRYGVYNDVLLSHVMIVYDSTDRPWLFCRHPRPHGVSTVKAFLK